MAVGALSYQEWTARRTFNKAATVIAPCHVLPDVVRGWGVLRPYNRLVALRIAANSLSCAHIGHIVRRLGGFVNSYGPNATSSVRGQSSYDRPERH